ncbi:phage antirepressor KilAC domain-containing protein, partial [Clostridium neonatale]|uniref:phage antirepressor KilAC domain-containing protein n=1 Tax=Clostridium neonatale TaxID=137838 RepID=UPI003977F353
DDVILVKEMATIITQNGFKIGQNQLFDYLRDYKYLCSKKGGMYNLPTKKHEDLFKVTKRTIQHTQGTEVKNTPKITGKGQLYFIKKFAEYKLQGLTIQDLLSKKKEAM